MASPARDKERRMFNRIGRFGATVAALAAVAVGASAGAGAATSNKSSGKASGTAAAPPQGYGPQGYGAPGGPPPGGAGGRMPQHGPETPLAGDTASKVK